MTHCPHCTRSPDRVELGSDNSDSMMKIRNCIITFVCQLQSWCGRMSFVFSITYGTIFGLQNSQRKRVVTVKIDTPRSQCHQHNNASMNSRNNELFCVEKNETATIPIMRSMYVPSCVILVSQLFIPQKFMCCSCFIMMLKVNYTFWNSLKCNLEILNR